MTWRTADTEGDRPPMRIYNRAQLDEMLAHEAAVNRSLAQTRRRRATPDQVKKIKELRAAGHPYSVIARTVHLSATTCSDIARGRL